MRNHRTGVFQPWQFVVSFLAIGFLLFGPLAQVLEQSLVSHMLLLYPLVIATGFCFATMLSVHINRLIARFDRGGFTGLAMITVAMIFWMTPRWVDASVYSTPIAFAKYLSLFLLVGFPLALSWHRMHPITRGVFKIEILSMLFRLGWLYIISPIRLCNSYLIDEQDALGWGLLIVGMALGVTWAIPVMFGPWKSFSRREHSHG